MRQALPLLQHPLVYVPFRAKTSLDRSSTSGTNPLLLRAHPSLLRAQKEKQAKAAAKAAKLAQENLRKSVTAPLPQINPKHFKIQTPVQDKSNQFYFNSPRSMASPNNNILSPKASNKFVNSQINSQQLQNSSAHSYNLTNSPKPLNNSTNINQPVHNLLSPRTRSQNYIKLKFTELNNENDENDFQNEEEDVQIVENFIPYRSIEQQIECVQLDDFKMVKLAKDTQYQAFRVNDLTRALLEKYEYKKVDYCVLFNMIKRPVLLSQDLHDVSRYLVTEALQNIEKLKQDRELQIQLDWQLGQLYDKAIEFEYFCIEWFQKFNNMDNLSLFRLFVLKNRRDLEILVHQLPESLRDYVGRHLINSQNAVEKFCERCAELTQDNPLFEPVNNQIILENNLQEALPGIARKEDAVEMVKGVEAQRMLVLKML
ncbi:Hypothetical_protein [Hexamita inflata]|uniref:Hypothetical_protein n=1 Tax=Hexamita inflata TaxID=28002 RepID=A0AA86R2K1_9EUKA|nr:Hypothetical protein HINF_LOCUS55662 [Hexamita inflata]